MRNCRGFCDVTLALDWKANWELAQDLYGIRLDMSRLCIVELMPEGYHPTKHNGLLSFRRFRKLKKLAEAADSASPQEASRIFLPIRNELTLRMYVASGNFASVSSANVCSLVEHAPISSRSFTATAR